ncbi:MAG: hypothetical protein Q8S31_07830 [Alphaproteobacteria bacterium]|nr:hypothetical protein [Alphaproteobacteria bacterium]
MVQFIRLAAFAAIVAFTADVSATDAKVEEVAPVAVTTTEEVAPVAAEEVKVAEEATKADVKAEEVKTKKEVKKVK